MFISFLPDTMGKEYNVRGTAWVSTLMVVVSSTLYLLVYICIGSHDLSYCKKKKFSYGIYCIISLFYIYGKITIVVTFEQPTLGRSSGTSIK